MNHPIKKIAAACAWVAAVGSSNAFALDPRLVDELRKTQIQNAVEIPIASMKAIESDGQINYVSNNGRYVIQGRLIDVLQQKPLDTIEQIQHATSSFSIHNMDVDLSTLNSIKIGSGKERIIAYVDPLCGSCIELMKDAKRLSSKYTFHFLVVPALGEKSNDLARRVGCTQNKEAAFEAILEGKLGNIPLHPRCNIPGYDLTLLIADMTGVDGVPIIYAPNGATVRGKPKDLNGWIQENMK